MPITIAIYIDILSPLCHFCQLSQQELHDHVKAIRKNQEFTWTITILKLFLDKSLDEDEKIMTLGHQKKIVQFGDTERAESISFLGASVEWWK